MLKSNVGRDLSLETKMREQFIAYLDRTGETHRRRAITGFYGTLAREGSITLLDYATAHEADLVGIFEGRHIEHVAETADMLAA